jgi:hypothetical protein
VAVEEVVAGVPEVSSDYSVPLSKADFPGAREEAKEGWEARYPMLDV